MCVHKWEPIGIFLCDELFYHTNDFILQCIHCQLLSSVLATTTEDWAWETVDKLHEETCGACCYWELWPEIGY
jgi:hypothetical protein